MKKILVLFGVLCLLLPMLAQARDIAPIVSTDWLEKNLTSPKIKIIDIRKVEEYREGHVPGALNLFFGTWAPKARNLQIELPADDDLTDILSSLGITGDSQIVIVGKSDNVAELSGLTRVAWTFKYAGLNNVAILDGAFNKWMAEKRPLSKDMVKVKTSDFKPAWNKGIVASKEYVKGARAKATLVDNRTPESFFGISKLPFVEKAGHIPGAVSLPSPWVFTKEGTFIAKDDLAAIAAGVVGTFKRKEMIEYCDTGKVATVWWFILSEVLDYTNVKSYDGSMEEWARDADAPVVKYTWR